jgi:hypothetical protein
MQLKKSTSTTPSRKTSRVYSSNQNPDTINQQVFSESLKATCVFKANDLWTYCHLSICQRGWFACVAQHGTCFDEARRAHRNAEVLLGIGETKCAVANFAWFATGSARLTSNSTQTLRPVATSCSIASACGA